ncbi:MAG TPA: MATE family efflux transporter [Thermoanaerobaculia bacterium]|nr:MATE family efflux transporter [Thermoanaerobaculia bacterium]
MESPASSVPAAPSPAETHGFWRSVGDALRGVPHDYTQGNIGRAILLLAVPMVLEMAMESLFAVCDIFFVSKLGPDAAATVGLTESLLTLIYALAIGLSMATTAVVARRVGEGNLPGAGTAAVQAIGLGVLISVPIGLAGSWFAPDLLRLMGGSPELVAAGWRYTAVMIGANAVIFLLFLINAIFRGAGDPAIAMRSLWLANFINILLGPCLIFGLGPFPELGIVGAAVATTIGRGSGVLYQLRALAKGRGRIALEWRHLRLDPAVMGNLLRVSGPGMFQFLIATASWIGLVRIISTFGSAALAGYTIAIRTIVFAILPSWGLSNAAATLVGQNLGAGRPDRAERSVWQTGLYNMVFLGVVGLVFILFAEQIIGIFISDPEVLRYGVSCLRYASYGYPFYAWGMVMVASFNGAGDTWTPTWINFFCLWLLQIPLAWVLSHQGGLGASGTFVAIAIGESMLAVVGMLAFRRGRWKERRV